MKKAEVRRLAGEGLDALLTASKASNDDAAAVHLERALERLTEAAGILPEGQGLREMANRRVVPVCERDYAAAERQALAKKGHALPDGSYPIADELDLRNAARLAASGHGDVAAAKRLIQKRAHDLGVDVSTLPGFGEGKAQESSLREAFAYATGEGPNPRAQGADLLGQLGIDRDLVGGADR